MTKKSLKYSHAKNCPNNKKEVLEEEAEVEVEEVKVEEVKVEEAEEEVEEAEKEDEIPPKLKRTKSIKLTPSKTDKIIDKTLSKVKTENTIPQTH